jgi:hypothetical protein
MHQYCLNLGVTSTVSAPSYRVIGLVPVYAPKLLAYPPDRKKEVQNAAITLLASVGRIDVLTDWSFLLKENNSTQSPES